VVSRNCTTCPCVSSASRFVVNSLHVAQATQIDMIVGSVANGLNSSGGFCAGSHSIVDHQCINGTSFVFSAVVTALLVVSASDGINILRNTPSILSTLASRSGHPGRAGPRRCHHYTLPHRLADHPYSPAFCGAVVVCDPECSEPNDPYSA
jgi:7-keto-8-aminopelargonate synthetase-like enzyme